jgi:hypothetical protein
MRVRRIVWWQTLIIAFCGSLTIWALWFRPNVSDSEVMRAILRVSALPTSVKVLSCDSPLTSDTITDCYAQLNPHDFSELLRGWKFVEHAPSVPRAGQMFTDAGTTFPVHRVFAAETQADPIVKHGGHLLVYVNESRTQVRTSIYIE